MGCVKRKAAAPRPARDLYTSALFVGRRRYVEQSCSEWWILSALHGLVSPEDVLEPYDVTLKDASAAGRRAWSNEVLARLDDQAGVRSGDVVEIHAGAEYRDFGIMRGLRQRSVHVVVPAEGLSLGLQLAFYRDEVDS